ncbi:MAG: hypothetical protein U0572_13125 [Phycisphaerales bacterium]
MGIHKKWREPEVLAKRCSGVGVEVERARQAVTRDQLAKLAKSGGESATATEEINDVQSRLWRINEADRITDRTKGKPAADRSDAVGLELAAPALPLDALSV